MTVPAETRHVETRIGTLHVEMRGSGPAVFCWPSLYCDARCVDPLARDLASDHRVVVIDPPGHGRSTSRAQPYTGAELAAAALEVFDAVGIERATWIGPAWGGHVGVVVATQAPERLRGLVVLNAPMARWRGRKLALMRLGYALLWAFGPRSFVGKMVADTMIGPSAGPHRRILVDTVAEAIRRCDRRGLLVAARSAMFVRADLLPILPDVGVPTVVLTGAEDSLLPVDEARAQAEAIPGCKFVVIEHSAHQSILEAPGQVLPIVREALAAWDERSPSRVAGGGSMRS